MKKLLLYAASLLTTTAAFAQTNFQPGYILQLSGDTLRGEIDLRSAQRNATSARFRLASEATITEYQPQQLRWYGFTGERIYQTKTVELDSLGLPASGAAKIRASQKPLFLEVIVQGSASLLYLRDERGKEHYYLDMPEKPVQELTQTTQQVVENNGTYLRTTDEFRYVLAAATKQCLALQPTIHTIRFSQRGLMQIVQQYNKCIGSSSTAPGDKLRRNHIRLGVVIGGERSTLEITDDRNKQYTRSTTNTTSSSSSPRPVVGLALAFQPTGVTKVLSLRVEALYESQSYGGTYTNPYGMLTQYRVKLAGVRFPMLIRYTYPKGMIRPFLQAGYGFTYLKQADNETRDVYTASSQSEWKQLIVPRTLEQGIVGGFGITTAWPARRNLSVEARYEYSDGFSDALVIGSRVKRGYLLLSYDLTR